MLDLSIIHRPGLKNGQQDVGRVLETMLYYDRVHLMMSAQMFLGFWDNLDPDDFLALLRHPSITTTFTPEMLAIKSQNGPLITTHCSIAMKLAGRDGKLIDDQDDVRTILQGIGGLPNRREATWAQVNKLIKQTKRSRYSKMLGDRAESNQRVMSLVKDTETMKLFIRGWASEKGCLVREDALDAARIDVIEMGDEFAIASTIALDQMIVGLDQGSGWGEVLNSAQDYAVDLYFSNAHSADIVTTPAIAEIASARLDMSIKRALKNADQLSAFEEMVFDEAHGFGDAYNSGLITFAEALKVIDQSRRFRTWTKQLPPDAELIHEYHRAVTKDTILSKLPASIARFSMFNGLGSVADGIVPGGGLGASAIDTFVVDRLLKGWRPNIFVKNVRKTLDEAKRKGLSGE